MLAVESLAARYGRSPVLHDVSLACGQGEIVCLLGRNGVGKTTTLKAMMGLLAPAAGRILFEGYDVAGLPAHRIARLGIGYVPEDRLVFPNLTVEENLSLGRWRGLGAPPRRLFERVYAIFPRLADRPAQAARTLSGGEQQMLTIGRALMADPKLLLVDEPTEGLAPVIVQVLEDALRALARAGTAVLVVESKLAVARRIADRVVLMAEGATVFAGSLSELEASHEARRRYLEV